MQNLVKHFSFLFLITIAACNDASIDKQKNKTNEFIVEGQYNQDSLENGNWKISDADSHLLEVGNFNNGVRKGLWIYYPEKDSIVWDDVNIKEISVRTNIPDFLKLSEYDGQSIVFKHADTTKTFTLLIGRGYFPKGYSLSQYRNDLFSTLESKQAKVLDSESNIIMINTGRSFLYYRIIAQLPDSAEFIAHSLFGFTSKNEPVEIVLRSGIEYDRISKKIFFSILPNFFIDSQRYLPLRERINN